MESGYSYLEYCIFKRGSGTKAVSFDKKSIPTPFDEGSVPGKMIKRHGDFL